MKKLNCWEFHKCGREPGGALAGKLGACPAATALALDGVHGGQNGGRACWIVRGTYCGGERQGAFYTKLANCMICPFCRQVIEEEGERIELFDELLRKLETG